MQTWHCLGLTCQVQYIFYQLAHLAACNHELRYHHPVHHHYHHHSQPVKTGCVQSLPTTILHRSARILHLNWSLTDSWRCGSLPMLCIGSSLSEWHDFPTNVTLPDHFNGRCASLSFFFHFDFGLRSSSLPRVCDGFHEASPKPWATHDFPVWAAAAI